MSLARLLVGFGLVSVFALASAQTNDDIAALEAALAAARLAQAEELANAQPEIAVENGNLHIRVGRDSDAHFERQVVETASVFDLATAVDGLVTRLEAMESKQSATLAPVPGALDTLTAALKTAQDSIGRVDDTVSSMDDVDHKVNSIPGQVGSQIDAVKAKMEKLVSDMDKLTKSVTDANAAAIANVDKKIGDAKVSSTASLASLSSTIDKNIKAANDIIAESGSVHSVYINWGSDKCLGKDVKTVYAGWTYASHHDHRGGSTPQCLKDEAGVMGGQRGGWDSLDQMYSARTDHCGGTGLDNKCNQNIPCSLCQIETHCYLETGTDVCTADGYRKQYVGWLYGSHIGQQSVHERICIAESGSGWGTNNGQGAYFYPSLNNHGIEQRDGDQTLKCHWCCDEN